MKTIIIFILFSSLMFGQKTAMTKLQELTNKIDSLINVNLNTKVDSSTVKDLLKDYLKEVSIDTSDFTTEQMDEALYYIRSLISMGYERSVYNIDALDKAITDMKNRIWLQGEGIPYDSLGLQKGQLYYNRTGNLKRKF